MFEFDFLAAGIVWAIGAFLVLKVMPRIIYNVESETHRSNAEARRRPKEIVYTGPIKYIIKF